MNIGHCLPYHGDSLQETVSKHPDNKPYQIMSKHYPKFTSLDLGQRELFIHGSHTTNISNPSVYLKSIVRDLQLGHETGCSGVVIHVGKYESKDLKQKPKFGLNNMGINLQTLLETAQESCPLILETPAGQGTELLVDIQEFIDFYKRFQAPNFKICIDTCHVFAAGYDPYDYLLKIHEQCGKKAIRIIHYNDSKKPQGSRVDRHAAIGFGHIPLESLHKVLEYAAQHGIPLVREC